MRRYNHVVGFAISGIVIFAIKLKMSRVEFAPIFAGSHDSKSGEPRLNPRYFCALRISYIV